MGLRLEAKKGPSPIRSAGREALGGIEGPRAGSLEEDLFRSGHGRGMPQRARYEDGVSVMHGLGPRLEGPSGRKNT